MRTYLSYSRLVKGITVGTTIVVGLCVVWALRGEGADEPLAYAVYTVSAGLVALLLWCVLEAPVYYELTPEGLRLSLVGYTRFYSHEIYKIDLRDRLELRSAKRVFGSGGFCGYLGLWSVSGRGVSRFYLTNEKPSVISIKHKKTGRYTFVSAN